VESSGRRWLSAHHPFTAPTAETEEALAGGDYAAVRGQHYDLVCNGVEVGGGSVRIHRADMQEQVLQDVLGMPANVAAERFGHLLSALRSGCPPHAGFALGFDRLVAIAAGGAAPASLRDVIAFPKNFRGTELLTGAPSKLPGSLKSAIGWD